MGHDSLMFSPPVVAAAPYTTPCAPRHVYVAFAGTPARFDSLRRRIQCVRTVVHAV